MRYLGSLVLATMVLTFGWAPGAEAVTRNVRYSPYAADTLDIYLPSGSGPFPAVLALHGGAWIGGRSGDLASICEAFAARGIACFSANYRLMDKAGTVNLWPTQLQDVQTAIRWIRAGAKTYHLTSQVCAIGVSVGAQLGLWLGSLPAIDTSDTDRTDRAGETRLYPTQSPQADCVVDIAGPNDLPALTTRLIGYAKLLSSKLDEVTVAARLAAASPINALASAVTRPTLIIQGRKDEIVDPEQAVLLDEAMASLQLTTDLVWTDGGHVFGGLSHAQIAALVKQSIDFVIEN